MGNMFITGYAVTNVVKQNRDTQTRKQGHAKQALNSAHYLLTGLHSESGTVSREVCMCGTVWMHSYIIALMLGTEIVPETQVALNNLTRLTA
jgi:hypothetical protein